MLLFLTALSNLESGHRTEGREQLERAIRRTAVSCYAAEGIYPPDLEYMVEHLIVVMHQHSEATLISYLLLD